MKWTYKGKEFTEEQIGEYFGIVYLITNLKNGRKYVGKKFFTMASRKQVNGKKKKVRVKSNWENYWGSNKVIKEDVEKTGTQHFTREILHLCKTKSELSYWETYEIFVREALRSHEYYNDWVSCRIRKVNLISKPDTITYKAKSKRKQNSNTVFQRLPSHR